uniref:Uncharacterized protein n=1 Tax=Nelumbo nucifera TaxID=4432 RepID=A0A822YU98_NELNU|nr:TPA_asm: hypothetical protein HUJ06_011669 [Nelumbo nucifera]
MVPRTSFSSFSSSLCCRQASAHTGTLCLCCRSLSSFSNYTSVPHLPDSKTVECSSNSDIPHEGTQSQLEIMVADLYRSRKMSSDDALSFFNRMIDLKPTPSVYSFSLLLRAIYRSKHYKGVTKGLEVDVFSYNALINGYCRSRRMDEAVNLFEEMHHKGLKPSPANYTTLTHGLC